MIEIVKRLIKKTPLAGSLRSLNAYIELHGLPAGEYRTIRDDTAMIALMSQVLGSDSTCIDVGANTGRVLREMLKRAPLGRHYAFEPIPQLADMLKGKFPQVGVHAYALGDVSGVATFNHVVNLSGWSGFRRQDYPIDVQVQEIIVEVRCLDDVVGPDVPVRFIKIDVEGAELQVLRGGINTIRRCRPYIVFEYAEIHGLLFGTTPEILHDYLTAECGMVVRSLVGRRRRLSRERFVALCRAAAASNYGRRAEGNFLACGA